MTKNYKIHDGGVRPFVTLETSHWTTKAQRQADLVAAGYPANERKAIALIRSPLLKLRAQVHAAIAPQLDAMKRWDNFINSGHSTFQDFLKTEMELTGEQTQPKDKLPLSYWAD